MGRVTLLILGAAFGSGQVAQLLSIALCRAVLTAFSAAHSYGWFSWLFPWDVGGDRATLPVWEAVNEISCPAAL